MRIGILSDTHIPKAAPCLPGVVLEKLAGVDLILHAGDLVELSVLEELNKIANTIAVYGNMDPAEVMERFPEKRIVEADGFKIGLIHGQGAPANLAKRIYNEFNGVDVIVFGHSHTAYMETVGKTLLFNPGSPTDKVFAPYNSFGILHINGGIKGEIIKIDTP